MESYQKAGVIISIIGIILGFVATIFLPALGAVMIVVNFITLMLSAFVKTHTKALGVSLIVFGIIGNFFLIIPGIMAIRYKPKQYELTK
jgi:hypothetical protein